MKQIGIFGAGVMGRGIAEVAMQSGLEVLLFDLFADNPGFLKDAQNKLRLALRSRKKKDGKLYYGSFAEADEVFSRMRWYDTCDVRALTALQQCDAVVEAIIEDVDAKKNLYRDLEKHLKQDTPIFSNTSTIQIARLAEGMAHPERFMGLHFFNPVPMMRLIEAIPHRGTSPHIIRGAHEFSEALGKVFRFAPDIPGFVANRLAVPLIRAACRELSNGSSVQELDTAFQDGIWPDFPAARRIVEEFINSAKMILRDQEGTQVQLLPWGIDEIIRIGLNFPMGPFALSDALEKGTARGIRFPMGPGRFCDLVGIDVAADCCKMLDLQEPGRWQTPQLLTDMIAKKQLGKKSGRGFYEYGGNVRVRRFGSYVPYAYVSYTGDILSLDLVKKLTATFEELGREKLNGILFEIRAKGANIKEFPLCVNNFEAAFDAIGLWHKYIRALRDCPVPITALIRDYAFGGGYESALACDRIIATKGSRIGLPEVGLGIMPGGGGTQNLSRRVGLARAAQMILGAKVINAKKPYVDEVLGEIFSVSPGTPLVENHIWWLLTFFSFGTGKKRKQGGTHKLGFWELARYYLARAKAQTGWMLKRMRPPASFWLADDATRYGYGFGIGEGMQFEFDRVLKAFATRDAEEGIRSARPFENRKPEFSGK